MARLFATGEKVFAKLRGYPAWPARVEGLADSSPNNMKYHVLFYGTMQRGICKNQELFPYLEHKDKFGKLSRAKGFKEALDQIEGLAPVPELVPKIVDEKYRNGFNNQTSKTLLNESHTSNNIDASTSKRNKISKKKENKKADIQSCAVNNSNEVQNYSSKPPKKRIKQNIRKSSNQKQNFETNNSVFPPNTDNNDRSANGLEMQSDSRELPLKTKQKQQKNAASCKEIKLSSNLNCSQKGHKLNKRSDISSEPGSSTQDSDERLQLSLPSRSVSRSGRVIKRKAFHDETQDVIPKRKKVQGSKENVCSPSSQQNQKRRIQSCHGQNIQSLSSPLLQKLPFSGVCLEMPKQKKQTARRWLATENCMTRLDSLIRAQLGMTRANPEQCINFLEDMAELDLKPLMLKKHPEVVETMKRLRRYVGNAGAWNFTEEQKKAFEELALQIRLKAEHIFQKFKVMFSVPENCSFLEVFADSVVEFQTTTQHWPLAKIYALVAEPKIKVTKRSKSSNLSKLSKSPKQSKSLQQKSSKIQAKSRKQPTKSKGRTTKNTKSTKTVTK
ncbi:Putative hepatoma-derived growth factor [Gryllus bimaculatus]|nr:Putative hepatoma-derived growth factor [Gryllus bimaculatus]